MEEDYEPTPTARVIERSRKAAGLSVRKAASLAQLSEGRWRQIALGYQKATRGAKVPVNAPAETLARMALAVGLDPEAIADLPGGPDVAEAMLRLTDTTVRLYEQLADKHALGTKGAHDQLDQLHARRDADQATLLGEATEYQLLRELTRRIQVLHDRATASLDKESNHDDTAPKTQAGDARKQAPERRLAAAAEGDIEPPHDTQDTGDDFEPR